MTTVGLSAANFANSILTALDSTAATLTTAQVSANYTADPGVDGTFGTTVNLASTKVGITWAAATGTTTRSRAMSGTAPEWAATGAATITHIAAWGTAGTPFRFSALLSASKTVANGDTLRLTALTFSITPVAT